MVRLDIDPPPSARRSEGPRRGRTLTIAVVVLFAGLGGGFWLGRLSMKHGEGPASSPGTQAAQAPAPAQPPVATVLQLPSAPTSTTISVVPAATAAQIPAPSGPRRLSITVQGALEESIASALPAGERMLASELTQVVNRILVWDLHVATDGRRGDRLDVVWEPKAPAAPGLASVGEPTLLALRYASAKLGGVLSAYRFEPTGARFAHYYRADGSEVELRLVDSPIAEYEQITSLLKDGRRHKGVDFKTPVGSPVVAPFDGVIERRNWNFAGNGNCLDLHDAATGRHAIFLHLEVLPKALAPGRKVAKGEVIASSGNSGHSFAPHLHYQLEDASGKVLDPFSVHRTERRALSSGEKPKFDAVRAQLDALMAG